ncbi:MAG: nucleotidyltransferase domain-containing protein [Pseudomonadota bacterium]
MMRSVDHAGFAAKLFGKTRSRVLALLFCNSDQTFHFREIARLSATSPGALQRELKFLRLTGLLLKQRIGNQVHYQANGSSSVFREIKSFMIKTAGVADVLGNSLREFGDRISVAFIFGSLAKGNETSDSDVDVMIIGDVSFSETVTALSATQEILRREVNPSVYPADEFTAKVLKGNHFLNSLIDEPKIFFIGDHNEFEKLVEKRLAG